GVERRLLGSPFYRVFRPYRRYACAEPCRRSSSTSSDSFASRFVYELLALSSGWATVQCNGRSSSSGRVQKLSRARRVLWRLSARVVTEGIPGRRHRVLDD